MAHNALTGTIPNDMNLPFLWSLDVHTNNLSGTIPKGIGLSSELIYLDLSGNNLTGRIYPSSMKNLIFMEFMYIHNNELTGEALDWSIIGDMEQLRSLEIGSNRLHGTIPTNIGELQSLEILEIGSNVGSATGPPRASSTPDSCSSP